jgi:heme exporter protein C
MTKIRVLLALAALAMAGGLVMALTAPLDSLQGEFSRIMHIHVPSSWLAFVAFGVTALASIMWRVRKTPAWDHRAAASAELGVLFTGLSLATGSLWGGAVWGTYWDWADPRMATTALMFFVYLGYLALRAASPDPDTAAARSSLLGIIAVVQVPLVYFSVNLFRGLHQGQSIRPDGATMPGGMLVAMLVNVAVFTLIYIVLLMARTELKRQEEAGRARQPAAGDAVRPPRFDGVTDV